MAVVIGCEHLLQVASIRLVSPCPRPVDEAGRDSHSRAKVILGLTRSIASGCHAPGPAAFVWMRLPPALRGQLSTTAQSSLLNWAGRSCSFQG